MQPFRNRRGMATPLILIMLLVGAALVGALYFASQNRPETSPTPKPGVSPNAQAPAGSSGQDVAPSSPASAGSFTASGEVFAGSTTPFVNFNQQDYDVALREGRVILLYFYANWCPICRVELSRLESAFNELALENVVGFRVSYNDNETDDAEENLARQFGIAYQHTKVILKNGQQTLKDGSTWGKGTYIEKLTAASQ